VPSQDALKITTHRDLYGAFITEVDFGSSRRMMIRVNSFTFLYSMIRQASLLEGSPSVEIDIEIECELCLVGNKLENGEVVLELRERDLCHSQYNMTSAQFLVSLSMLISSLVQSLKDADVDVEGYLRRFPPPLS
jgi:hypothetical protein